MNQTKPFHNFTFQIFQTRKWLLVLYNYVQFQKLTYFYQFQILILERGDLSSGVSALSSWVKQREKAHGDTIERLKGRTGVRMIINI